MSIRQQNSLFEHLVAGTQTRATGKLVGAQRTTAIKFYHQLRQLIASKLPSYKLSGKVDADESYFGDRRNGTRGRGLAERFSSLFVSERFSPGIFWHKRSKRWIARLSGTCE